jgi:hypothetical protein
LNHHGQNETDQRIYADNLLDKAFDLHAEKDGYEVKDPEQYRLDYPSGGFTFTAVQNNTQYLILQVMAQEFQMDSGFY